MKYLGPLLAGGLTLLIVIGVGIFSFLPAEHSTPATVEQPTVVEAPMEQPAVPPSHDRAQLEAIMAERESVYQAQITQLDQALQERQVTYQDQIQDLTTQITALQSQLNELNSQEQNLLAQVAQLETTRSERLAIYQSQLQQAQDQYKARYAQLQAQFNEAQLQLAQANAELGR